MAVTQFDTSPLAGKLFLMPTRVSLNVSLTPELEKFVHQRVNTGRYQTASEVIREGLRLLEYQERDRDASFVALKKKLARASAQADKDEFSDPAEILKKIELRKRKRK